MGTIYTTAHDVYRLGSTTRLPNGTEVVIKACQLEGYTYYAKTQNEAGIPADLTITISSSFLEISVFKTDGGAYNARVATRYFTWVSGTTYPGLMAACTQFSSGTNITGDAKYTLRNITKGTSNRMAISYEANDSLKIEAEAQAGYEFYRWETQNGTPISSDNPYTFTATGTSITTIRGAFTPLMSFSLEVSEYSPGCRATISATNYTTVSVSAGSVKTFYEKADYPDPMVTLTAIPSSNGYYTFTGWWDAAEDSYISRDLTDSFSLSSLDGHPLSAVFEAAAVSVNIQSEDVTKGTVSVASLSPKYGSSISLSGTYNQILTFSDGTDTWTVSATPEANYRFSGWTLNGQQVRGGDSVVPDGVYVANFALIEHTVTVETVTGGTVYVDGVAISGNSQDFIKANNSSINVKVVPSDEYYFSQWVAYETDYPENQDTWNYPEWNYTNITEDLTFVPFLTTVTTFDLGDLFKGTSYNITQFDGSPFIATSVNINTGSLPANLNCSTYTQGANSYLRVTGTPVVTTYYTWVLLDVTGNPDSITQVALRLSTIDGYRYALYFNSMGGVGGPASQESGYVHATSYTFPIPSVEPSRPGQTFLGWYLDSDPNTIYRYGTANNSITVQHVNGEYYQITTLKALWTPRVIEVTVYAGNTYQDVIMPQLVDIALDSSPTTLSFNGNSIDLENMG